MFDHIYHTVVFPALLLAAFDRSRSLYTWKSAHGLLRFFPEVGTHLMPGALLDRLINSRLVTGEFFQHDAELFRMAYQRSAL